MCGQYCIYFLLHRARGVPMRIILNDFGPNVDENDKLVFDFVQRSFDFDDLTLNTLRPRQVDTISQTTFSNAFSWM